MTSGWPLPATTGSASCGARLRQLAHQRQRVDLALERHESGDDGAGRDRDRKRTAGDGLGGLLAVRRRQRVAARGRLAAQD